MLAVATTLSALAANPTATMSTSMGDIKVELFLDRVPRTASNFIDLAQTGEPSALSGPRAQLLHVHESLGSAHADLSTARPSLAQASTRACTSTASFRAS
jgi:hypothetical protein